LREGLCQKKNKTQNASTILKKEKLERRVRQWRTFTFEAALLHLTAELGVAEDANFGRSHR
jgi:hypothetical protein